MWSYQYVKYRIHYFFLKGIYLHLRKKPIDWAVGENSGIWLLYGWYLEQIMNDKAGKKNGQYNQKEHKSSAL